VKESGNSERYSARGAGAQLLPWVAKSTAAFIDQLLTSGSNFLGTILLARWLTASQYGAYAMAFSVFLLLSSVHVSLLIDPMPIFGPSVYRDCRRAYLGLLLWIHGGFSLLFTVLLAGSSLIFYHLGPTKGLGGGLAGPLAGLALAVPWVLLLSITRQAFYIEQSPGSAAAGAGIYSVLVCSGLFLAYRNGALSPFTAFVILAFAALVSSVLLVLRLKPALKPATNGLTLREVWEDHWKYGRWAWATSTMRWIPANIAYLLTGGLLGMADVGALKALLNLLLPFSHTAVSVSRVFQPYLSGVFGREGGLSTRSPVERVTLVFLAGGTLYGALLILLRKPIFGLLYGGKFVEFLHLVPWVALGAILIGTSYGPSAGLKAIQSPASVFVAYAAASAVSVVFTFLAVRFFGLAGAIAAFVLSSATVLIVSSVLFRRKVADENKPAASYDLSGSTVSS